MVGLAVLDGDSQGGELGLESAPAVSELGGEDAAVEFLSDVKPLVAS
jgi:hypothetical protein